MEGVKLGKPNLKDPQKRTRKSRLERRQIQKNGLIEKTRDWRE
jgi:hypothetical protein